MTLIFLAIIWLGGLIVGIDEPLTDFIGDDPDNIGRPTFAFVVLVLITFIGDLKRMWG